MATVILSFDEHDFFNGEVDIPQEIIDYCSTEQVELFVDISSIAATLKTLRATMLGWSKDQETKE